MKPPFRHEFLRGVRDGLPILIGVLPFGLVFGTLAIKAGLTPAESQGLSLFVFAGSAQFVAVQMIAAGAAAPAVVATILLINLRHLLYSASVSPYLARLRLRWRLFLAYLLTDEAFAVSAPRWRQADLEHAHAYYMGAGVALWTCWQLSTALGIAFGARIPESLSLAFALPLTFLAMLLPTLIDRPAWSAAIAGGLLSLALRDLPYGLGLILAVVIAVGVGVSAEALGGTKPAEVRDVDD